MLMLRRFLTAVPVVFSCAMLPPVAHAQAVSDLSGLSDDQLQQTVNFVIGNAIFALYHEASRMLISDLDLPDAAPGLDTADQLTASLILEANEEWLDTALVNATDSWYLARIADALPEHAAPLYSSLVPNKERDRQIACLMVGKDADGYGDLVEMMGLPKDQWQPCISSYSTTVSSWSALLEPHQKPSQATKFKINYEPSRDPSLELYATMIKESQVLDLISRSFNHYALKGNVKLTAKSCGRPDVYWSAEKREITYCYELGAFHGQLIADHLLGGAGEEGGKEIPTAINLGQEL